MSMYGLCACTDEAGYSPFRKKKKISMYSLVAKILSLRPKLLAIPVIMSYDPDRRINNFGLRPTRA